MLTGLVLIGGRSLRMGSDKSVINYHGKPQRDYLYDLLGAFCSEAYLSCRAEQANELSRYLIISDIYPSEGPLGALLSAFEYNPDTAWLVVACDMPFVNADAVDFLQKNRDCSKIATAFLNLTTQLPEPLFCIWEPEALPVLKAAFANNQRAPTKILEQNQVALLRSTHPQLLWNVNTKQEYEEATKSNL